jgi:hypothetical protein
LTLNVGLGIPELMGEDMFDGWVVLMMDDLGVLLFVVMDRIEFL